MQGWRVYPVVDRFPPRGSAGRMAASGGNIQGQKMASDQVVAQGRAGLVAGGDIGKGGANLIDGQDGR